MVAALAAGGRARFVTPAAQRHTRRVNAHVHAPDGRKWEVRRRTLLWRPRRRMGIELDLFGILLGVIALPLLAVEWVLASVLTAVTAAVKVALRRPWRVEAVLAGPTTRRLTWNVEGWRASGRKAEQLRAEIAAGQDPTRYADQREINQGG
jgi:hypothetical protein